MSVETFTPNQSVVSLTEAAIRHFEGKLNSHPDKIIRLSTKVSGCTGYAYVLDFADTAEEGDTKIAISDKLTLAVEAKAVDLVRNTEIDYVQEGVNGVVKFNNPNVVDECGCGESFNVG
ncbi:Iron-sulfur cluster assembly 1 like protein, mitochondrial [Saliniradius amylolyticus]|uniref:Iron-sulfur cluster assembly 1 like protein, mitochondrial n=1 Tax=Saliniradius amylolyticus TaxID=2183582 RepID=A0A2S2E645_9ALTE|nr:iron-sulfur cluster assembly accessory protein [Saliniradius amylolyticus]AWL12710.1 Iron-sulfur cluster assembly 1 like protein, mitochondrial [Saliniradius amylolyticus]